MATEQYANNAQTSLVDGIDAIETSITVINADLFPPAPQFRIRIDSELLLVTAGAGTTTWTVEREIEDTDAAAHSSGATVTQVLTAGGLENLLPLTTKGDLLVHDGTDNVRLAVGSNGQVLTADSAETVGVKWATASGGAPTDAEYLVGAASGGLSAERVVTDTTGSTGITWDLGTAGQAKANAPNAGKWIKLATATASSSATVDFTLPAGYVAYKVVLSHIAPATDGVTPWLRTSGNGGSSYDSGGSDYDWVNNRAVSGSAVASDNADSEIELNGTGNGNAAGESISGCLIVHNPAAAAPTSVNWQLQFTVTSGAVGLVNGCGRRLSATAVDAIRFLFSSGNVASGLFDLFGLSV